MQKRPLSTPVKLEKVIIMDSMSGRNLAMSAPNILQNFVSAATPPAAANRTQHSSKMVEYHACLSIIPDLMYDRQPSVMADAPVPPISLMCRRPSTMTASAAVVLGSSPSKTSNAAPLSGSTAAPIVIKDSPPSSPPSCSHQTAAATTGNAVVKISPFPVSTAVGISAPMSSSNDGQSMTWPAASSSTQDAIPPTSTLANSQATSALQDLMTTSAALPQLPPATKSTVATVTRSEIDFIMQCILPTDHQVEGQQVENNVDDWPTINSRRRSPLKTVVDLNQTQQSKATNGKTKSSRILPWTFFCPYLPKVKTITREMLEVSDYLDTLILLKTEQDKLMENMGKPNDYPFVTAVHQMNNIVLKYPHRFPDIARRYRRPQQAPTRMPTPQTVNSSVGAQRQPCAGIQRARVLGQGQDLRNRLVQIVKPMSIDESKEATSVHSTQPSQSRHCQTSCSQERENKSVHSIISDELKVTADTPRYTRPGCTLVIPNTTACSLRQSNSANKYSTPQVGLRVSSSVNINDRPQDGKRLSGGHHQNLTCTTPDVKGRDVQRLPAVDFILSGPISSSRSKW